jgi:hypothetical protein
VNPQPKLVEEKSAEADFIDDIAELLPAEQRPLWYRDMAHLRRLPADDEMLRIARAMGFLALVTRQTPVQIAIERERLAAILDHSVKAIQSARRAVVSLHQQLEERLTQLPAEISEGINPKAIAAKLSESLRQQFAESGIPETAQALVLAAKQTKQVAGEFDRSSRQVTDSYRCAAEDAGRALDEIRLTIQTATGTAKQAATDLTHTFLREYKWSLLMLCSAALAVGFSLGILYYRWMNASEPEPTPNTVVVPLKSEDAAQSAPATHSTRKTQRKPTSPNQGAQ